MPYCRCPGRDWSDPGALSSFRRRVDDCVVSNGVVDEFAHGVDDDGDEVRGCRTDHVAHRSELEHIVRVAVHPLMQVRLMSMCMWFMLVAPSVNVDVMVR